jgi:hypothetical protein
MRIHLTVLLAFFITISQAQLKSPEAFLPTKYKQEFTPHNLLVDYVRHAASESKKIKVEQFGYTNEARPQVVCYISSPQNLEKLEDIRKTNLYNAGLGEKPTNIVELPIIWLSYSVHGNEAAGSESAMSVIYDLISDNKYADWLNNALIIINPSINPDGYSRYTSWNRGIGSSYTNPELDHREHDEPWPRGRVSHYLFDLNRDWAWQTQKEIKNIIALYNNWMPHVHADIHEMGMNSPYYFAPAAEPIHKYITPHQRDFQMEIGKNHAKYFDTNGWLYFTRETFDLFYPSYGDTYPTYNGAIGMTYEKGGIGAGRAALLNNGTILTLADRIQQHKTTSLSTIEIGSKNGTKLISNFKTFFSEAAKNPKGQFKTYVLKDNPKLPRLLEVLNRNGINFSYANETKKMTGFSYQDNVNKSFDVAAGDVVVQANQPRGTMTQLLLELNHDLPDSNTYDITAWSLPLLYNIETYGMTTSTAIQATSTKIAKSAPACDGVPYAYIIPWNNIKSMQILAKISKLGYVYRIAKGDVQFDQYTIQKGSIIITRGDNPSKKFDEEFKVTIAEKEDSRCLSTGMSSKGGDLGGGAFILGKAPRILTLTGEGTYNNEVGQIWHHFDEVLNYPITQIDVDNFNSANLANFNVLILPDGSYSLNATQLDNIKSWIRKGGRLIAMSSALEMFNDKEGWALSTYATDEEKSAAKKDKENRLLASRKDHYHDYDRAGLSSMINGAIVENKLDASHPLTFGLGKQYFSMKNSTQHYKLLKGASNPIYVPANYRSYGFIGNDIRATMNETVTVATEDLGRGKVIYMVDNPLFRGFIENGNLLFGNAVWLNW